MTAYFNDLHMALMLYLSEIHLIISLFDPLSALLALKCRSPSEDTDIPLTIVILGKLKFKVSHVTATAVTLRHAIVTVSRTKVIAISQVSPNVKVRRL